MRDAGLLSVLHTKIVASWEGHVLRRSDRLWIKRVLDIQSAGWLAAPRAATRVSGPVRRRWADGVESARFFVYEGF